MGKLSVSSFILSVVSGLFTEVSKYSSYKKESISQDKCDTLYILHIQKNLNRFCVKLPDSLSQPYQSCVSGNRP